MTSNSGRTDRAAIGQRLGPGPYLVVGLVWLGIAHLVARYKTIEPLYLWILTQSLLLEKVSSHARWLTELVWFAAYALLALVAWRVFEKPGADRARWWMRAALAWLAIQVAYAVIAVVLVRLGILYE